MEQVEKNSLNSFSNGSAVKGEAIGLSNQINRETLTTVVEVPQKEHNEGNGNPFLTLDPGMYIWTLVSFVILLVILGKFAWRPILKVLDEREEFIANSLKEANIAKKELEEVTLKQEKLIFEANEQVREIVNKGKETAEKIAQDIEGRAKVEASKILLDAKREIENEREKIVSLLKLEMADLVIQTASKLIDSNLDDEKNRQLVESAISEINK